MNNQPQKKPTVSTYALRTAAGSHIRIATQVTFPDGTVIRFIERLNKNLALREAARQQVPL